MLTLAQEKMELKMEEGRWPEETFLKYLLTLRFYFKRGKGN